MKKLIFILILITVLLGGCAIHSSRANQVTTATAVVALAETPTILPTSTPKVPITNTPLGWWNQSVFYEIFVRSFKDSNGDGIGDFQGIIQKLDYLNDGNPNTDTDLGINAIWLMPINPAVSYHGYDVTDYMDVNPQFGTMDDFRQLMKEAHARGIKIIIDFVINHTANQHPWFKAALDPNSPYHDYYIWSKTDPGYLGPSGQTVWHHASNGEYYYGVFDSSMPDLNYRNPKVTEEINKVAKFWLSDVGVDGFRIDAARHLIEDGKNQVNTPETHQWFKDFRKFYKGIRPNAVTVGEVWDSSSTVAGYVAGDELDLAFDFDLAQALVGGAADRSSFFPETILSTDLSDYRNGLAMATFLTNHDITRSFNNFSGIVDKAKNAVTMLLTIPGVPFIYYGEEIGMTGAKPDQQIRTPMQWDASVNAGFTSGKPWELVNSDFQSQNVSFEESDPGSLLSFYKQMIKVRLNNPVLQIGNSYPVNFSDSSVFAELRTNGGIGILTILNLTNKDIPTPVFSLDNSDLTGNYKVTDLLIGKLIGSLFFTDKGSFDNYSPMDTLPANARLVLYLESEK